MKSSSLVQLVGPILLGSIFSASALAQFETATLTGSSPLPYGVISLAGDAVDNVLVPRSGNSLTLDTTPAPPQSLGAFSIVIVPGTGLASNAAALAAFNRAAQQWVARIADPITVTINADLGALGPNIIGSTSSVILQGGYDTIRNQMVLDAADELDDTITASLPTSGQFSAAIPSGSLTGNLLGTKANLKALGFAGLDTSFGIADATMTFSNTFAFDFDNSNGVGAGLLDFETVAAHEIGHALGFVSEVDSIDGGATSISPFTLDLHRFANNTAADPTTAGDFTTFSRNLIPGVETITDQIFGATPEWGMSTGVTNGDGRQASHWKADELTGQLIGIMDPTLSNGVSYPVMEPDFRALDLIGYEIAAVPEVSTVGFGLVALAGFAFSRRRARQVQLT
jgi:hypothetical protein